jgi:hypothetical protein
MFASKDVFLTPPATGGYTIGKSVRLRSSANANLSRTFGTPTNNLKWTWSAWVKRGALSANIGLLGGTSDAFSANWFEFYFGTNDTLKFDQRASSTANVNATTTAVFRDPAAWYHIVFVYDSPNATANNRTTLYVNGVLQALTYSTGPVSINTASQLNASGYAVGMSPSAVGYFDGYLTEVNFIDGQALTPSSFGSTNALTGVWQPAKYTGTYGTNGFYLNFSSNGTSAALGTDFSGNSNTWTVNNISVTAGVTYDSMTDVPTLTSATVANYAVMNPLAVGANSSQITFSNGNLTTTWSSAGGYAAAIATIGVSSGKWYWEIVNTSALNSNIGILKDGDSLASYVGQTANGYSWYSTGSKYNNASSVAYASAYAQNDVIGVALDMDGGTLTFYKNGTSQGQAFSGLSGTFFPAVSDGDATNAVVFASNFGQRPFSYTPPTGYVALNTYNLPAGSITTSGTFTGNASTDGPFVYLNGVPTAMTINGNAVTFGTNADHLANGFKVRSSSASYNASGSNTYTISTTGAKFKNAIAQTNP